ncbi:hypothetical protein MUK42_05074, partial [Musa troglodytarum]
MGKRSGGQLRSVSLFLALVSMTNCEQLLTISGAAARPSSSHTTKPPPTPVSSRPTPSTPARPPPTLAASPLAAGAVDARSPPHCPHTQSFLRRASPLPSAESPRVPPPQASCLPFLAMLERDLLKPLPPAMPPAFGQLPTLVGNTDLSSLLLPSLRIAGISLILIRLGDHSHKSRVLIGVIVLFFKRSTNQDLEESQRHGPIRQDVQEIEIKTLNHRHDSAMPALDKAYGQHRPHGQHDGNHEPYGAFRKQLQRLRRHQLTLPPYETHALSMDQDILLVGMQQEGIPVEGILVVDMPRVLGDMLVADMPQVREGILLEDIQNVHVHVHVILCRCRLYHACPFHLPFFFFEMADAMKRKKGWT